MPNLAEFSLTDSRNLLQRTPAVLDAWLRDLPDEWLHANEGPKTFSPFAVVGHLIYGERTDWIGRARHILEKKEGAFVPFDRFGHEAEFEGKSIGELLDMFSELRAGNLDHLDSLGLTPEHLDQRGTHPTFGDVSLRQLLSTWTVHDQGHIAQIARVIAKRYSVEVGPWSEFLPILTDRS